MNYWNKLVEFLIGPKGSDVKTPTESKKRVLNKKGSERKPQSKARKAAAKRGRGRPKGSKNKKKISGHTNKKPKVGSNRSHWMMEYMATVIAAALFVAAVYLTVRFFVNR